MKNTYKFLLLAAAAASLSLSCSRGRYSFVDFGSLDGADESAFKVISTRITDLSEGIPADCLIPADEENGTSDGDAATKTTSTSAAALVADLFEYNHKGKIIEISGIYKSYSIEDDSEHTLSGKILLPKGQKPKRYIIVSHYTIGSNAEAPSNVFPLEGVLCDMGYAMIFPDYQGYGVDSGRIHPYLVLEQTAYDVCMMYIAVDKYLKNTAYHPEHEDIYLMGYSQGGAVTMATQWMMEDYYRYYWEAVVGKAPQVRQVFAGGGPYDVRATYSNFVTSDKVNIPCAVPMVIQGMVKGTGMDIDMQQILQPWIYEKLDEWINSKKYTVAQLRNIIGTTKTSDLLTETGMDQSSDIVAELYKRMSENSIVAYDWTPKAPVYMLHSMDDDVVPFVNASKAKSKWKDGNIQYNFGHYGSHMKTALRFIYSVKTWLKEEGE